MKNHGAKVQKFPYICKFCYTYLLISPSKIFILLFNHAIFAILMLRSGDGSKGDSHEQKGYMLSKISVALPAADDSRTRSVGEVGVYSKLSVRLRMVPVTSRPLLAWMVSVPPEYAGYLPL